MDPWVRTGVQFQSSEFIFILTTVLISHTSDMTIRNLNIYKLQDPKQILNSNHHYGDFKTITVVNSNNNISQQLFKSGTIIDNFIMWIHSKTRVNYCDVSIILLFVHSNL